MRRAVFLSYLASAFDALFRATRWQAAGVWGFRVSGAALRYGGHGLRCRRRRTGPGNSVGPAGRPLSGEGEFRCVVIG